MARAFDGTFQERREAANCKKTDGVVLIKAFRGNGLTAKSFSMYQLWLDDLTDVARRLHLIVWLSQ